MDTKEPIRRDGTLVGLLSIHHLDRPLIRLARSFDRGTAPALENVRCVEELHRALTQPAGKNCPPDDAVSDAELVGYQAIRILSRDFLTPFCGALVARLRGSCVRCRSA